MNTSTLSILSHTRPSRAQSSDSNRSMCTRSGKAWVPLKGGLLLSQEACAKLTAQQSVNLRAKILSQEYDLIQKVS